MLQQFYFMLGPDVTSMTYLEVLQTLHIPKLHSLKLPWPTAFRV